MAEPEVTSLFFDERRAFYDWAERQPEGRWEREDGFVVSMAPERVDHARIKAEVWDALRSAIRSTGAPCEAFVDGPAVEIGQRTDFVPDVVVDCGPRRRGETMSVGMPVVVVEVLSPSTGRRDMSTKLEGYFRVHSIQHYLLVDSGVRRVMLHSRLDGGKLLTRIHHDGAIVLDPPGLTIEVAALYRGTDLDPTVATAAVAPGTDGES